MAPGTDTLAKRPSFTSRNSSASVKFSQSPADTLSTSAQRQRNPRHVVGQTRMGQRVPSFSRNVNKLTKLTPAYEKSAAAKGHPRRNLSNLQQLTHNNSTTVLRQNHSETSLKKNRSHGQLTKLTRPHSSKGALKSNRPSSGKKRRSSQNVQAPEGPANPTVRFDLGDEDDDEEEVEGDDGWVDSVSHSASTTRSNTRRNSMINPQDALENGSQQREGEPGGTPPEGTNKTNGNTSHHEKSTTNATAGSSLSTASTLQNSRPPDADRITSKLLSRNTSFSAVPRVSSVSAGVQGGSPSQASTLLDSPGSHRLVSRFVEANKSESGTPEERGTPPHHVNDRLSNSAESDPSPPNDRYTAQGQSHQKGQFQSSAASQNGGPLPSSRTQQKLWLERQSANMQSQHMQAPFGLLRSNRLSSANLPYAAAATNGEGRLDPPLRQLCEQSDNAYKRVRMFHNPLADAIQRLQDAGEILQGSRDTKVSDAKQGQLNGKQQMKPHQSQTMPAQRSTKNGTAEPDARRPKVTFQGLKGSKDDGEVINGRSTEDNETEKEAVRLQKAEAREICRRMWDLSLVSNEG